MSLFVNTNLDAQNALDNLRQTDSFLSTAMQRLSSGLRINSSADDVAGYAIVQGMTGQLNGLTQAEQNTQDGVSLVQTAEGSLGDVTQMLQRIRELAVQYSNGTNATTDQQAIVSEANQLCSEIERIGTTAEFNGIFLLNSAQTITFQVGANDGEQIAVATISLGALANAAAAFGANDSQTPNLAQTGFTLAEIQSAYEAAFASVYGPTGSTPTNQFDPGSQTYDADEAFGAGDNIGGSSTFGADIVFGPNVSIGGSSTFGAGDVFGAGDRIGGSSTFSADTSFDQNVQIGGSSSFGDDTTFGNGDIVGGSSSFGSNTVNGVNNNDTSWPTFLQSVSSWTPSTESMSAIDTNISDFLNSVSEPSPSVTSFIAAFNTQLAAAANPASDSVDIATIDSAINNVSAAASTFGAVQNRLSYTLSNNTTYAENLSAATSHIEDTNMASEMSLLTMDQVLQQAGVAVLSQANHAAQSVLTLIQNG